MKRFHTSRPAVFSVEDRAIQVHWGSLPAGPLEVAAGERSVAVDHPGGPGAVLVDGLEPGQDYAVRVAGRFVDRVRTLTPPPGALVHRIATISDLHIGESHVGLFPTVFDHRRHHATMCARSAIEQLVEWGADLLVVKGDLTNTSTRAQYDELGPILAAVPIPMVVIPGNHDGGNHRSDDVVAAMARHGVHVERGVAVVDVPGVRVVVVNTMRDGRSAGEVVGARREAMLDAVAGAPGGVLVFFHHQLQPSPLPLYWPPGIVGRQAVDLADALVAANPATIVSTGHTHRHRRRDHGPLMITEVGSPKDYPGTWAGYAVHEGGVRQQVRRVHGARELDWTERTGRILLGQWGRWSIGTVEDRCFSHTWPSVRGRAEGWGRETARL